MYFRKKYRIYYLTIFIVFYTLSFENIRAENGYDFWLRYEKIQDESVLNNYKNFCKEIVVTENQIILNSAKEELKLGISKMLGIQPQISKRTKVSGSIIIGVYDNSEIIKRLIGSNELKLNAVDGYRIISINHDNKVLTIISGNSYQAVLYGAFHFLRLLQTSQSLKDLNIKSEPADKLRMVNHWDNPSGSIERGYSGRSIFHWDELPDLETRYYDYARMLASIGINGCVLNNVNTAKNNLTGWKLITTEYLKKLKTLAEVFKAYGIKIYLSVNFSSPTIVDSLMTADPLDISVVNWWEEKVKEIYSLIPNFGGFLVKADSEGEPGPFKYNRTPVDGANMLAKVLKPYGGILIWRAFVYKHNDTDRAAQAYKIFKPLDGLFADNVIIQIKNGPIDFQVREPISPLFGAMPKTNQMLELQITQEYTGQSTHLCYLVPQWKEILNFDTYSKGEGSTVSNIVSGIFSEKKYSGITGVSNIGI